MVDEVHAHREVGAADFDLLPRAFRAQQPPEFENCVADGAVAFGVELFAVEELAHAAGGVGTAAESETVGEPEVVEAHVFEVEPRLAAEEAAEERALRETLREAREGAGIGVETRRAVDALHAIAHEQLGVVAVAEGVVGELAARVERHAHAHLAAERLEAGPADQAHDAPDVGARQLDGVGTVEAWRGGHRVASGVFLERHVVSRVGETLPEHPFDRRVEVAVVDEQIRAVAQPPEERDPLRLAQQRIPVAEELAKDVEHEAVVLSEQRLRRHLQRDVGQHRHRRVSTVEKGTIPPGESSGGMAGIGASYLTRIVVASGGAVRKTTVPGSAFSPV